MKFLQNLLEKIYNNDDGTAWFMALVFSYAIVGFYLAVGH